MKEAKCGTWKVSQQMIYLSISISLLQQYQSQHLSVWRLKSPATCNISSSDYNYSIATYSNGSEADPQPNVIAEIKDFMVVEYAGKKVLYHYVRIITGI